MLSQTYEQWLCWIIDDGSSDNSTQVINGYIDRDERFNRIRSPVNKGAVAANELGMHIACNSASWWVRLGSDDTFLPHKLELDALALRFHDAVFGPYMAESVDGVPTKLLGRPMTPLQVKQNLETPGSFAASWANVAARTQVLGDVKKHFGSYGDSRIRNMDDLLFNFRLSSITDWVWRGRIDGEFVMDPSEEVCRKYSSGEGVEYDATWTQNPVGLTQDRGPTQFDAELSWGIIAAELQVAIHNAISCDPVHSPVEKTPAGLDEFNARRLIGELLKTRATKNWKIAEHGDRLGQIWEMGRKTANLTGSVAELGIGRGGTTRLLSAMFPTKDVFAFDCFEGPSDTETKQEALQDCSNVIIYLGKLPEAIDSRLRDEHFSLVHIDTNNRLSIHAGLEFFVPRMVSGGMIFINNYGWDRTPGVKRAVDEILADWPALKLRPTTPVQALLQVEND